jgi:hypothetical protein
MKKVKSRVDLKDVFPSGVNIIYATPKSQSIIDIFEHINNAVLIKSLQSNKNKVKIFYKTSTQEDNQIIRLASEVSNHFLSGTFPKINSIYLWDCQDAPDFLIDVLAKHTSYEIKLYRNGYSGQNKYADRKRLGSGGVNIPPTIDINIGRYDFDSNDVIIIRPIFHSKGENFQLMSPTDYIRAKDDGNMKGKYATKFIDKDRELRIHCGGGKVFSVLEKFRPTTDDVRWNRVTEGAQPFTYINWNAYDKVIIQSMRQALLSLELLNCHHGAVDIIIKDDVPFVLEVNKAVGLDAGGFMTKKYALYLQACFASNLTRQSSNFPYKTYKKGKSFVWKKVHFDKLINGELNNSESNIATEGIASSASIASSVSIF